MSKIVLAGVAGQPTNRPRDRNHLQRIRWALFSKQPSAVPTTLAFGERVARVRDPQGHLWWLQEHVEDVAPEDLASRFADPAAQEAMAYVQRTLREELAATHAGRQ